MIGMPEGEEKEQEIGNLFEKVMKNNVPNLVKEIDMQVQEAQRVPNKMDAKRPTLRQIIIQMPKVKDKNRIFLKNIFIDYAITVVPFPPPHSTPYCPPPPSHIPPL